MRLLMGLGQYFHVLEVPKFALVGQAFVEPGCLNNLHGLVKPGSAFFGVHAERGKLRRIETATRTPVHAAFGENVEQGDFLGEA